VSAAGEEESLDQNRLIEDREELSSRQAMEASYIHQDGISNLRFLPGSDSENDLKLVERSVIYYLVVVRSRRDDSRYFLKMIIMILVA
jgi:hypothetical protein